MNVRTTGYGGRPVSWRHYLKRRFFAAVAAGEAAEFDLAAQMDHIGAALLARRPDR